MKLHAFEAEVARLASEAEVPPDAGAARRAGDELAAAASAGLGTGGDPARSARAGLAWHLRQRDAARAIALAAPVASDAGAQAAVRARAALAMAEATALLARFDEAEAALALADELLADGVDSIAAGDARSVEAVLAKARGQRTRELAALEAAVQAYRRRHLPEREAVARASLAFEASFTDVDVGAEGDALDPGPRHPEAACACDALRSAARAIPLSRRDPRAAVALFLHAADRARAVGLVRLEIVCTVNAGAALQGLADHDRAATCFDRAHGLALRTGWPGMLGVTRTRLGALLAELGAFDESRAMLEAAIAALAVAPVGINMANACAALAQALLENDRAIESIAPMEEALRLYREARSTDNLALNLIFHGRALARAGRARDALRALDEAAALVDRFDLGALRVGVHIAQAEAVRRDPSAAGLAWPQVAADEPVAVRVARQAEAALEEGRRLPGWKAPPSLFEFLADAWHDAGDDGRAYRHAKSALVAKEAQTRQRLAYPVALLKLRLGTSVPSAASGLPGATATSGRPDVDGIDGHRAAAPATEGRTTPAASPAGRAATPSAASAARSLTRKEGEILQMLARNFSNKEIAQSTGVSEETVKWHLKNVFAKLGAGSRRHAVVRARTLGFIGLSD